MLNLSVQNVLDCISENFNLKNFPEGARTVRRPDGRYRAHIATVYYSQLFLSPTPFRAGTKCPSKRDVRLIESQIKGVKKGRDQL